MERDQLDVDILLIGAGPASLATALHLSQLVESHNNEIEQGLKKGSRLEPSLLVVEKGRDIGSHILSGAVIDPRSLKELLEGLGVGEPPYEAPVREEKVLLLSARKHYRLPLVPPPLQNHGCYVASLGQVVRWMAGLCENRGIDVYAGFPATELLMEGETVVGARMADSGVGHDGTPKSNFEPGIDVRAKVTVLGEGTRGTLAGKVTKSLRLDERSQPQVYAIGLKELWKVPEPTEPGTVCHTLGFPLGTEPFGGGFLYTMRENLVSLGLVVGLDYRDPRTDPHFFLEQFRNHPWVQSIVSGGERIAYGAKTIPEGGFYAMPKLFADGLLLVGDSAGFLNSQRLKGIHLAIKSGMLAAETLFEALLKEEFSAEELSSYETRFKQSRAKEELWKARNFRQSFQSGFFHGLFHSAAQSVTGGSGFKDPFPISAGHSLMERVGGRTRPSGEGQAAESDPGRSQLKLRDLYYSDTSHEEDQPSHLKILDPSICDTRCGEEFGYPCRHFCPAAVYEVIETAEDEKLKVNFSNCIHCKTCEIADPYQIILWTPPEGGGGPGWNRM